MANADQANGFRPVKGESYYAPTAHQTAASQTIAVGDMVYLDTNGFVNISLATTGSALGVAASAVSASAQGDEILVYDNPNQIFEGQCSGTPTRAQMNTSQTNPVDIEGATGVMEINEDASTENLIYILGASKNPDGTVSDFGVANTRVLFKIALHNANGNVTA